MFYLVFTLASFIVSAFILQREANQHMHHILENRLTGMEHFIKRMIEKKPEKVAHMDFAKVEKIPRIPDNDSVTYRDTMMMNEETQQREIHRLRISYATIKGEHYRLKLTKSAEELYRFRDDVFEVILPVFILLALGIIIINYLLSGYLFKPFQRILNQMAAYQIGTSKRKKQKPSTTREFFKLQQLFEKMQQRIEDDYFQLKEYTEDMSHELQTPLSIIQNKAEQLIADEHLTQEQAEKLKVIYDESKQLSRLGSALNLITKIENQEFTNVREVKTEPVIREHVQKIEEIAGMRNLHLQLDLHQDHTLTIDLDLLNIMLRNLFKNAIYYASEGSTVKIYTGSQTFEISNRGEENGFSEEELFKRFKRGNNSKSLGLGLAIVYKICRISQLKISYHYQEGEHTFTIQPS